MAKTSPAEFMRQVRQEVSKVTWPARRETVLSTIMVFLMAVFVAVFFFLVDRLFSFGVSKILGIGS